MKNGGAAKFVKRILCVLRSMAKAKSMAIKSKTDAIKARLIVLSLLRNKKLSLGSISNKIHGLIGGGGQHQDDDDHQDKAIVLYNAAATPSHDKVYLSLGGGSDPNQEDENTCSYPHHYHHHNNEEEADDDDKYPDLTHSLFDDELDLGGPNASVIDLVRNSKEEGKNFSLEDEIDHVADLFIMKFHKNMRMQKLESFKRYQEMLQRST